MLQRIGTVWHHRGARVALALLVAVMVVGGMGVVGPQQQAKANGQDLPLLLIHGYGINCHDTFDMTNYLGLIAYLNNKGYSKIQEIGYYTQGQDDSLCDANLQNGTSAVGSCDQLPHHGSEGTLDEPLQELGCQLAWYIYNHYTYYGQTVNVVAHSMGGLIIRDAIGESGVNRPAFPPKILVNAVVTVGTPHAGLGGSYYNATLAFGDGQHQQVYDMQDIGSFMTMLQNNYQAPQGAGPGTKWALIGSSIPCGGFPDGVLSCLEKNSLFLGGLPDGDGLIQASSTVGMKADLRVLYGAVEISNGVFVGTTVADSQTEYRHGIGCDSFLGITGCLHNPFYLYYTDFNAVDTGGTRAWMCTACGPDMDSLLAPDYLHLTVKQPTSSLSALRTIYDFLDNNSRGVGYPIEGIRTADEAGYNLTDWYAYQQISTRIVVPNVFNGGPNHMEAWIGFNGDFTQSNATSWGGYLVREGLSVQANLSGTLYYSIFWEVDQPLYTPSFTEAPTHPSSYSVIAANWNVVPVQPGDTLAFTLWRSGNTIHFDAGDFDRNLWPSTTYTLPAFTVYSANFHVSDDGASDILAWSSNAYPNGIRWYNCRVMDSTGGWHPIAWGSYHAATMTSQYTGAAMADPSPLGAGNDNFVTYFINLS